MPTSCVRQAAQVGAKTCVAASGTGSGREGLRRLPLRFKARHVRNKACPVSWWFQATRLPSSVYAGGGAVIVTDGRSCILR